MPLDGCGEDPSEQQRGHAWNGSAPTVKRSNAGRASQAAPMSRWSRARRRAGPPVRRAGEQEGRSRARRAAWPAVSTSTPRAEEAPARLSVGRSARPRAADVQARRSDERLSRDMQRYSLSNHRQAKSRDTCNVIHYQTIGKRKIPFRDRPSLMMTLIDGRRLPWNFEIGS